MPLIRSVTGTVDFACTPRELSADGSYGDGPILLRSQRLSDKIWASANNVSMLGAFISTLLHQLNTVRE